MKPKHLQEVNFLGNIEINSRPRRTRKILGKLWRISILLMWGMSDYCGIRLKSLAIKSMVISEKIFELEYSTTATLSYELKSVSLFKHGFLFNDIFDIYLWWTVATDTFLYSVISQVKIYINFHVNFFSGKRT